MKESLSSPPASSARQRLLEGAARVFARDGIAGSTTREIAREAGVNEVTLFRHFQSKDGLIAAVISENFGAAAIQAHQVSPLLSSDLRTDLTKHAVRYDELLKENLPLIRTMIGEIHHHADHERQVFKAIFRPLRESLLARLQAARTDGQLIPATDPEILADLFLGMIFTGVLRRNLPHYKLEYTAETYLEAAVDLVVRGAGIES
ncbi:MAG TPA: TetR/AcrR family transcriptional regulator [Lacunisphaera sp.]|jgi:AcrR family transcriptional regulator